MTDLIATINHAIKTAISQQDRAVSNNDYQAWREIQTTLEQARDALTKPQPIAEHQTAIANCIAPDYLEAWNPRLLEQQLHKGPGRLPRLKD